MIIYKYWQQLTKLWQKAAFLWGAFFILFNVYCFFWRHLTAGGQYQFMDSQVFWFKEWGALCALNIALVAFVDLKGRVRNNVFVFIIACTVAICSLVILRIFIDYSFYGYAIAASFIQLLPKYLIACCLVLALWRLCSMSFLPQAKQDKPEKGSPKYIEINHKGVVKRLSPESILFIKAAGNYVEIQTLSECFLKRDTIKNSQAHLPCYEFKQVHRSYLVNLAHIEDFNLHKANATLQMKLGFSIPVSKTFKPALANVLSESSAFVTE
ncbi:LytTR family DNA-binding domain-containing protein [Pseudoalteromonas sp. MEBiC 03485]|uniref:LytR/AlgR family response regulator transcription factor n=1 Tax=Pseudoalteromonas sp. MEBiC 03485 TaxID=2571103 RepID=UPI001021A625|nr:LytTR family DNA-binding domain-containing protein [Pseudoalteromonas sp. MEBiC 03485]RZD22145.1 LytTR family transcriptional regulator [Pseudoalteromonas sp. MEBiC 03485]